MKIYKIPLIILIALLVFSSAAIANDFGWTRDFNIQAHADPSGVRARLATRFNIGDFQVKAILNNLDSPATNDDSEYGKDRDKIIFLNGDYNGDGRSDISIFDFGLFVF